MQPNYLSTELDRRTNVAAVRGQTDRATSAMAPLCKAEIKPWSRTQQSDEELLEFCRNNGPPSSTPAAPVAWAQPRTPCPSWMPLARARNQVCVWSIASVMPTLVSGSTNAPVVMMAEKAADLIRKTQSSSKSHDCFYSKKPRQDTRRHHGKRHYPVIPRSFVR